jgi:hypothetical protein
MVQIAPILDLVGEFLRRRAGSPRLMIWKPLRGLHELRKGFIPTESAVYGFTTIIDTGGKW